MNCPNCNQVQSSGEARFCRRCGAAFDEAVQSQTKGLKAQKTTRKGVGQGLAIFLFGLVLITVLAILRDIIFVPQVLIKIAALVFCLGGIIRMCYPYIFNTGASPKTTGQPLPLEAAATQKLSDNSAVRNALPEAEIYPPMIELKSFDTARVAQPISITEYTTKSLKDRLEQ